MRRSEIGRVIHLDASTLTRNLAVMLTNGWIEEVQDHADGAASPCGYEERGGFACGGCAGLEESPGEGRRIAR